MCSERISADSPVENRDGRSERLTRGSRALQEELTSLADVLGRKWNLVIIDRLLAAGPMGFSVLLNDIEGVSSKVLSESLADLEAADFVDRTIVSERPFRVQYSLTERGRAVEAIIGRVREGEIRVGRNEPD